MIFFFACLWRKLIFSQKLPRNLRLRRDFHLMNKISKSKLFFPHKGLGNFHARKKRRIVNFEESFARPIRSERCWKTLKVRFAKLGKNQKKAVINGSLKKKDQNGRSHNSCHKFPCSFLFPKYSKSILKNKFLRKSFLSNYLSFYFCKIKFFVRQQIFLVL